MVVGEGFGCVRAFIQGCWGESWSQQGIEGGDMRWGGAVVYELDRIWAGSVGRRENGGGRRTERTRNPKTRSNSREVEESVDRTTE